MDLPFDVPTKHYLVDLDSVIGDCGTWTLESTTVNSTNKASCVTMHEWSQDLVRSNASYASNGSKCGWVCDTSGANVKLILDVALCFQ